ncbi:MAG: BtpA/SgcQ family protein [Candidatus Woesearchaeota archaeon]
MSRFEEAFPDGNGKVVIGMIHLFGGSRSKTLERALHELFLYKEHGLNGAILEDYHGSAQSITDVLEELRRNQGWDDVPASIGVNYLRDTDQAFKTMQEYGLSFVQVDCVDADCSCPQRRSVISGRETASGAIFGGVRFKGHDASHENADYALKHATQFTDAIVVTGTTTGVAAPLSKIEYFRKVLDDFPLIVGSGVSVESINLVAPYVNGFIIGSAFKPGGETRATVESDLIEAVIASLR